MPAADEAIGELPAGLAHSVARLAEEILFAGALEVDACGEIPAGHFRAIAQMGLYGIAGPREAGGLDLGPLAQRRVREALAGGCLSTAFVWAQHHGVVRCVREAPAAVRDVWLPGLCSGQTRAGQALAGLRPGPATLLIEPTGTGWRISGHSPMVSGWGCADVLLVGARVAPQDVVLALVDTAHPGLRASPRRLAALDATRTVQLGFEAVDVDAAAVIRTSVLPGWAAAGEGVRANGALALGVAQRCASLAAAPAMHDEVAACRRALDLAADGDELARARAAAALLAMRLSHYLVAARGSAAVELGEHAQRLAREAIFLLAFGQRPDIRECLLDALREDRRVAGP